MSNRPVGKNNRIPKHLTNFKFPPFCVDVINVWSLIRNNFKKRKRWISERLQRLNLLFHSVTRFFLFVPQNKIYMITTKKQNVLYD